LGGDNGGIRGKIKAILTGIRPVAAKDKNSVLKPRKDARQRDAPYGKDQGLDDTEKKERASRLTPREHDMFLLLLEGCTLKETAVKLGIAYSTVNTHQMAIYKKLEVNSKAELIINFRCLANSTGQSDERRE